VPLDWIILLITNSPPPVGVGKLEIRDMTCRMLEASVSLNDGTQALPL